MILIFATRNFKLEKIHLMHFQPQKDRSIVSILNAQPNLSVCPSACSFIRPSDCLCIQSYTRLSVHLHNCLSFCPTIYLFLCLNVFHSVHLSVSTSVYPSVCLLICICPFICLSVSLFICIFVHSVFVLSVCPSLHLSGCLYIRLLFIWWLQINLFVYLSIYLLSKFVIVCYYR